MQRRMDRDYELQTHQRRGPPLVVPRAAQVLERVIDELRLPARARILDAGCGSGRNMVEFARHGTVTGVELSPTERRAGARARRRRGGRGLGARDAVRAPTASSSPRRLDVIEHLEDDLAALRELRRVVAPGGTLLVTVPAYQWLWSGHDEINHHHRRYTRRSLQRVGEQAGWQQVRTTYFNSLLLPVAIAAARARPLQPQDDRVEPRPVGAAGAAQLAARAPAGARGGDDRPRRADSGRALAARRLPLSESHLKDSMSPRASCVPDAAGSHVARRPRPVRVHAERPGAVDEERRSTVTMTVAHACASSLSMSASWTNRYSRPSLSARPQPCTIAPAHRRERVADVPGERPAAVEQEAVDRADDEADRRRRQVPDAEDLQQHRVDREREQRVRDADDPELDELHQHRRAQPRQPVPVGWRSSSAVRRRLGRHSQTG